MDISEYERAEDRKLKILEIAEASLERNILVYDSDAKLGTFSRRLIPLMQTVFRRQGPNMSFVPRNLYVPYDATAGIATFFPGLPEEELTINAKIKLCGLDVGFYDEYNEGEAFKKTYDLGNEHGYPPGKENGQFVFMTDGSDQALMGVY